MLAYANPFLMIPLHFFVLWNPAEKHYADLHYAWLSVNPHEKIPVFSFMRLAWLVAFLFGKKLLKIICKNVIS